MFPDVLPPGLPARRCIDHTIPTQPGVLPIRNMDLRTRLALKAKLLKLAEKSLITHTPSPSIANLTEQLHGARYFTIMDMQSGFH